MSEEPEFAARGAWPAAALAGAELDLQGTVLAANEPFARLVGRPPEGVPLVRLAAPAQAEAIERLLARAGGEWSSACIGLAPDAQGIPTDCRVWARRRGERIEVAAAPLWEDLATLGEQLRAVNEELVEARRQLDRVHRRELDREREIADRLGRQLGDALERREAEARRAAEVRRGLLERLVRAQEEERERIASDIHDDYLQAMSAIAMQLDRLADDASDGGRERIEALRAQLEATVARMRHLVFELRPPALDWAGLTAAVRMLLEQTTREWGLEHRLDSRLADEPGEEARVALYRIVQEAVANARKHARASLVHVVLESRDGGVLVRVLDDGIGIADDEVASAPVRGHFGLAGMRERAEMAGGWWRIEPRDGGGTAVSAWLPGADG